MKINLIGETQGIMLGLEQILPDLNLEISPDGYPITVKHGDCLRINGTKERGQIEYAEKVQFFRALSLLVQHQSEPSFEIEEHRAFQDNGVMFDVSRNAVLLPETLKFFFRKMALMGLNLGMMYTEDTYEVEGLPYFGYLRGKYSKQELKDLDDYADALGIELIPCIQTLAHMERALQWAPMDRYKDTHDILMVGEDSTYELLEQLIVNASEPYRSNRIHIGMDEAWDLGLCRYLKKNGYRKASDIMKDHLTRVNEIIKRHHLEAMMWSDMFCCMASPTGDYCDIQNEVPQEVLDIVPKNLSLVYWDYYHETEELYHKMFRKHQRFEVPVVFAGGIWSWSGIAVNYDKTLRSTIPALKQCKETGVSQVFATAWGDNGAECNLLSILYGMQIFAEYDYTGRYNQAEVSDRFIQCCGANPQAYLDLSLFDSFEELKHVECEYSNPSKYLLYEDVLLPLFTKDTEGIPMEGRYRDLAQRFSAYRDEAQEPFALLFDFYARLADTLARKCAWRDQAATVVRDQNRAKAQDLADEVPEMIRSVRALKDTWRRLWFSTNKPYGFEVIDNRLGGQIARMESAQLRMKEFADGMIETIPELAEEKLYYKRSPEGTWGRCFGWHEMISACKV